MKLTAHQILSKLKFLEENKDQINWVTKYLFKKGIQNVVACKNMKEIKQVIYEILCKLEHYDIEKFVSLMNAAWTRHKGRHKTNSNSVMLNVSISREHMKKLKSMSKNTLKTNIKLIESLIDGSYEQYLEFARKLESEKFLKKTRSESMIKSMQVRYNIKISKIEKELEIQRSKSTKLEDGLSALFNIIEEAAKNDSKITAKDSIAATKIIKDLIG
ncbi:hypothetical protein [Shewanella xiamenensis]|uniref:hypothetical protein n=1 Tax=Shewanella xiamenensis TaxID=332186 RepID=UPI0024A6E7A2|nr:hypothetical protein [Shewanella xiamenensis]MDI5838120.1 hypothetical protein [Shewanella xiamenensis]MDI5841875.1 hypothetical protein [Shewanella xiamenensis]MDI5845845.1 hypothetical protein [Shewanella xiamenensis]MDI5847112.1 hypothetical protein [Shewanella xiamenensis]MDI5853721.1 hypothetical protein [Shewanella xiamenensis]